MAHYLEGDGGCAADEPEGAAWLGLGFGFGLGLGFGFGFGLGFGLGLGLARRSNR